MGIMSQQQLSAKKQQGKQLRSRKSWCIRLILLSELQMQYTNYKDTLQAIAQKIGDVEQETEEHK